MNLSKETVRPDHRTPGTWKPLTTPNGMSATVTCPKCGTYGTLEGHRIHKDGRVWPSLICPNDCGFHETVTLEGWE